MAYETDDLVRVAARDNNSKRSYLYVNPLQAKHIPVNPCETMKMVNTLAEKLENAYGNERLFIIGFAETATAISAGVAVWLKNAVYYQTTTREVQNLENEKFLYFTESHSHATEQKLAISGYGDKLKDIDRIVFVEDEVTTGNTIMKLVDKMKKMFSDDGYGKKINFSIASILNSMSDERLSELKRDDINCICLCKIPFEYRIDEVNHVAGDRSKMTDIKIPDEKVMDVGLAKYGMNSGSIKYDVDVSSIKYGVDIGLIKYEMDIDFRTITDINEYRNQLDMFVENVVADKIKNTNIHCRNRLLVMGTEEFMFPAIYLGNYIAKNHIYKDVKTHSTTRSPILVSDEKDYPLHMRYEISSFYDSDRRTFIYNLEKYDQVIVVTDAKTGDEFNKGEKSLITALKMSGNSNISVVVWSL